MLNKDQLQLAQKAFNTIELDAPILDCFRQMWSPIQFKRHELITEIGQRERYFYIVIEGVQALYVIDHKGEKVVLGFSFPGNFSGVFDSFRLQTPSNFFLEALTPSTMLAIGPTDYQRLFDQFPIFERWGRLFMEGILMGRVKREVELITLSSKERYQAFMRRCPEPLRQIPQKYLASYLNMQPETFSRLRATVQW